MKKAELIQCGNIGMVRDKAISQLNGEQLEFAFDNHNIRITVNQDNTLLSITNEKGPQLKTSLVGLKVGSNVLNNYLTIFTTLGTLFTVKVQDSVTTSVLLQTFNDIINVFTSHGVNFSSSELSNMQNQFIPGLEFTTPAIIMTQNKQQDIYNDVISSVTLILFNLSTHTDDRIYRIDDQYNVTLLYNGDLLFYPEYPLETLSYYESENVQKVYWVDGLNTNRFINIVGSIKSTDNTLFDCTGHLHKIPQVSITKNYNKLGFFPEGTILYFITYYNKFGTESGIVYASDLLYLSRDDRGCKEGENAIGVFDIGITNVDTDHYDYLRIYSVIKTSSASSAITAIVQDIPTSNFISTPSVLFTDDNASNIAQSAGDLNFIGGENLIASTLDLKRDTLFLGDIKKHNTKLTDQDPLFISLQNFESIRVEQDIVITNNSLDIVFDYKPLPTSTFNNVYNYKHLLEQSQESITGFKYREIYRFALQFQTVKGEWTEPIYIGDKYCHLSPKLEKNKYYVPHATYTMNAAAKAKLDEWNTTHRNDKFILVRLLMAEMTPESRRIAAQGVVNPTMFNYYDRTKNTPHSINSWMFRPRQSQIANQHYDCMKLLNDLFAEIQGITTKPSPTFDPNDNDSSVANSYALMIGLTGSWASAGEHDLYYELYLYHNDGGLNTVNDPQYGPLACPQYDHNKILEYYSNSTDKAKKENKDLKLNNKDLVRLWLIDELNSHGVNFTDEMIPTGIELKRMRQATVFTDNTGLVWALTGAIVLTLAATAVTICTFGSGMPIFEAVSVAWASVIGSIGATCAGVGAAATATIAELLADAPEIDLLFAKKGYYTLLPEFNHRHANKIKWEEQYDAWRDNLFGENINEEYPSCIKTIKDTHHIAVVLVQHMGRLTFLTKKELAAKSKLNQYYIDESIVTLNSPELEDNDVIINDLNSFNLDLIGTIPITASYGESSMYTATNGVADNASTIDSILSKPYKSNDIEGLINGGLYLDVTLKDFRFDTKTNTWPDINPLLALSLYKIFMWNRTTSWSCYIPTINIKDKTLLNDELIDYISYIPAMPKKKVFGNLKFSHATNYHAPHSMDIESPQICNSGYSGIVKFMINQNPKYYYGSVDTLLQNTDGYVLMDESGTELWLQPEDKGKHLKIYDPIHIKFNTTTHALIPLKWITSKDSTILPYLIGEHLVDLGDFYTDITETSIIEGITRTTENNDLFVCELPPWLPTATYTNDPLETLNNGDVVPVEIINQYKKYILDTYLGEDYITNMIQNTLFDFKYECSKHNESTITCPNPIELNVKGSPDVNSLNIMIDKIYKGLLFYPSNVKLCNLSQTKYICYQDDLWYCYDIKNPVFFLDYNIQTETGGNVSYQTFITLALQMQLQSVVDELIHELFLQAKGSSELTYDDYLTTTHPTEEEIKNQLFISKGMTWDDYWKDKINTTCANHASVSQMYEFKVQSIPTESDFTTKYQYLKLLNWKESNPYLFMGELTKKNFLYSTWLGGTSKFALQQLNWNICSNAVDVQKPISMTWGDTYYQRWDCLKTYPTTEEDKNSIVDVLSFMVETHINIDGRCDVNRGVDNLVNARPNNFNLLNKAYTLHTNYFQYKITDDKFDDDTYENLVVWSLTKTPLADIDPWTNISTVNYLNLNGCYGKLRKLLNLNDVLLTFLDTGICSIDYDLKVALSTIPDVPVQLGNTNKVQGYTVISPKYGCHNKWSICNTDAGVFFIDDYNKSLLLFSNNNLPVNVSTLFGFEQWFKDNIDGTIWNPLNTTAWKISYDSLTKDLYIIKNNSTTNESCLTYNVLLQKFTSFMDYPSSEIFNFRLNSTLVHLNNLKIDIYKMFDGNYNILLNKYKPYWITYKLNPSPHTDNLFTNFTYIADCLDSSKNLLSQHTFTSVKAWNEYQSGELDLTTVINRHRHSKQRYRIWNGDIPRDGDTLTSHVNGGNRMRNPWLYLQLTNNNSNDLSQMIFHNLTVTYYK